MNMNFSRYEFVRKRLIELYDALNNKSYRVWIAPEKLMTLDQIRHRPNYDRPDFVNDNDYYQNKQMRRYTVPKLIGLMHNLDSCHDIPFEKPNVNLVEVYENIQEWISLWCDIMRLLPDFKHPPIEELRRIENLAYMLFQEYKRIKSYLIRKSNTREALEANHLNDKGLAALSALFGMNSVMTPGNKNGEISWYSHIDALLPEEGAYSREFDPGSLLRISDGFNSMGTDSLSHMDNNPTFNPDWIFNAG